MAFILKSDSPSESTRPLYRDALVNVGTRILIDSKNSFCWNTPDVLPVPGKALRDVSPGDHATAFIGSGFDDSTASDGIHFQQGSTGVLEVGSDGEIDLSTQNVSAFYIVIWMARAAGFDVADFQGIAEHGLFNHNDSAWIIDLGQDGTSPELAIGQIGNVGQDDRDLTADEVIQYGFSYETDGVDTTLKKYKDGALYSSANFPGNTGLLSLPTRKVKIGTAGSGANAGFRLYRFIQEVIDVSSGPEAASGADIAERIAFDYRVNKNRFTF